MKIKTGDTVYILSGKDKGKQGKVIKTLPKKNKLVVEGVNIAKKHVKKQGKTMQAGIIEFSAPLFLAKAMFVCQNCQKRTRIKFNKLDNGKKVRICKQCGAEA